MKAVVEEPVPRKEFLKKRIKKLGWSTVSGQVLFQMLVARPMADRSIRRKNEIIQQYGLEATAIPQEDIINVPSVNADSCLHQLKELQPDLIVVHGTRIISKKILQGIPCLFINIHAGITPRYRGSHGAYWALANNDAEHCGVTVHLVDAGIDTGYILFQGKIPLTSRDNFVTYPYLQLAEGLLLLRKSIELYFEGKLQPIKTNLDSALWHHPTLWGYLWKRLRNGVK
jgi:methionyl-tRNA formyltransferase